MQDSITKLINESIQNFSKLSEDKSQLILIEEITNVIMNSDVSATVTHGSSITHLIPKPST